MKKTLMILLLVVVVVVIATAQAQAQETVTYEKTKDNEYVITQTSPETFNGAEVDRQIVELGKKISMFEAYVTDLKTLKKKLEDLKKAAIGEKI